MKHLTYIFVTLIFMGGTAHAGWTRTYTDGNGYHSISMWKAKGKWGFIDKSGNYVIKPKFNRALGFTEGLASVEVNGTRGFIDKKGDYIIKPKFDSAWRFHDGLAIVEVNRKWGFIDKSGNYVIKPKFDKASSFSEGLAAIEVIQGQMQGLSPFKAD